MIHSMKRISQILEEILKRSLLGNLGDTEEKYPEY
jgi:hypothetical protein